MALPPEFFTLVENELYAWKRDRLAGVEQMDRALGDLQAIIARLAPDLPLEEGSEMLRAFTSPPMLHEDGEVVRLTVRFVVREDRGEVELQDVEAVPVPPGA